MVSSVNNFVPEKLPSAEESLPIERRFCNHVKSSLENFLRIDKTVCAAIQTPTVDTISQLAIHVFASYVAFLSPVLLAYSVFVGVTIQAAFSTLFTPVVEDGMPDFFKEKHAIFHIAVGALLSFPLGYVAHKISSFFLTGSFCSSNLILSHSLCHSTGIREAARRFVQCFILPTVAEIFLRSYEKIALDEVANEKKPAKAFFTALKTNAVFALICLNHFEGLSNVARGTYYFLLGMSRSLMRYITDGFSSSISFRITRNIFTRF